MCVCVGGGNEKCFDFFLMIFVFNIRTLYKCQVLIDMSQGSMFGIMRLPRMMLKGIRSKRLSFISEERGWRD